MFYKCAKLNAIANWSLKEKIMNDLIITVVRIYPKDRSISFHVTSFIQTIKLQQWTNTMPMTGLHHNGDWINTLEHLSNKFKFARKNV